MVKTKRKNKYLNVNRITTLAVLTAMSLIMFMVESLFPPLFIPGAKMGISNIFSLLALVMLSPIDALICVLIRTTLGSMFIGNMSTLMYSLTAGVASILLSSFLIEFVYPKISIISISVVSAVLHNLVQNLVFCLVTDTPEMLVMMVWLALLGVIAGFIVGVVVYLIVKFVPTKTFAKVLNWEREDNIVESEEKVLNEDTDSK